MFNQQAFMLNHKSMLNHKYMLNQLKLSNHNHKLQAILKTFQSKKLILTMNQLSHNIKFLMKDNMLNMFHNKELNMYQSPEVLLNTKL
jgi:hypothetical protein